MTHLFECRDTSDVLMLPADDDAVLRLIGKPPAARGIIETPALPAAILSIQQAIAEEAPHRASATLAADGQEGDGATDAELGLRQRSWPLLQMMVAARAAASDVVWTSDAAAASGRGKPRRTFTKPLLLSLFAAVTLAACGSGEEADDPPPPATTDPTPAPNDSQRIDAFQLPGHPHRIESYRPAGASRAIVFLHGGGGTLHAVAFQMGLKSNPEDAPTPDTVNWTALSSAGVIAVFPQGQAILGNARTWRNHVMESGQDDLAFLQALAADLRLRYGITSVALAGHSMGGAMVHRVWCESPGSYQSYVSFAGPASSRYLDPASPCLQAGRAPYLGLFGSADPVIPGAWEALTWTMNPVIAGLQEGAFVNPVMIGEWQDFVARARAMCGETPVLASAIISGAASRWRACGSRLQVQLAHGAGHGIDSISATIGQRPFDLVSEFTVPR